MGQPSNWVVVDEDFKKVYETIAHPPLRKNNKIIIPLKKPPYILKKEENNVYSLRKNDGTIPTGSDIYNSFPLIYNNILANKNPLISGLNNYKNLTGGQWSFSQDKKFLVWSIKDEVSNKDIVIGDHGLRLMFHRGSIGTNDKINLLYPFKSLPDYKKNYLNNISPVKLDGAIDDDHLLQNFSSFIKTLNFIQWMGNFFTWDGDSMVLGEENYNKFFEKTSLLNTTWWQDANEKVILKYITPDVQEKTIFIKEAFNINGELAPLYVFNEDCSSFLDQLKKDYCYLLNYFLWLSVDTNFSIYNKERGAIGLDLVFVYYFNDQGTVQEFSTKDFHHGWMFYGFVKFLILKQKNMRWWLGLGFNYDYQGDYFTIRSNVKETNVHQLIDEAYHKQATTTWESILKKTSLLHRFSTVLVVYIFRIKLIFIVNPLSIIFFKLFNVYMGIGYNVYYKSYKNDNLNFLKSLVDQENILYESHVIKEPGQLGVLYG